MSARRTCGDSGGVTKAGRPCRVTAIYADTGLCIQHDPSRADERRLAQELRAAKLAEKVDECQYAGCHKPPASAYHRYCTDEHRVKAKVLRQQAGGAVRIAQAVDERIEVRRGPAYDRMVTEGLMPLLSTGAVTYREAAEAFDFSVPAVSRAVAAWQIDQANAAAAEGWLRPELPELTVDTVDEWVAAFVGFRDAHFRTRDGSPFITTDYMLRWVRSIFMCLATGGRQAILSPPRHGKTEMLQHTAIFLICYNPNICIMWVSKSEKVAAASVRAMMDHLENNESLIAAFCPPGEKFKPDRGRSTKEWSPSGGQFTVDTRTITGITSPTMVALSRTGTVRNRSADLIVVDDLEDHKSTQLDGQREATRNFVQTELESRKEDHTAWFVIGSRAHIDDWYHYLLLDPEWDVIVEEAHSSDCALDPNDEEAHVECMLWPEVRSYSWLRQKFRSAEAINRRDLAEMVYLNRPTASGVRAFIAEDIDPCLDRSRSLGDIPPGTTLIAGLDPSGVNFQAAFLWAFRVGEDEKGDPQLQMWMVDTENRKGGGIAAARETVAAWWEQYKLSWWVVEKNLYHGGIREDTVLVDFCGPRGIRLEDYQTGGEKWDEYLGVSSMVPLFQNRQINLPYANAVDQAASGAYRGQLLKFSAESKVRGSRRKSDLVMASWFPLQRMRQELDGIDMRVEHEYDVAYEGFDYEPGETPW